MSEMPILTGISQETLRDLDGPGPKTLVLVSAQNVASLADASAGDDVFLTEQSARDLVRNTEGLVSSVVSMEITMHRHYHRSGPFREEHEATVVQVQLEGARKGRLAEVTDRFQDLPIVGEVNELPDEFRAF